MKENIKTLEANGLRVNPMGPPFGPGVYCICCYKTTYYMGLHEVRILYIGSSKNITKRILNPNHPYLKLYRRGIMVFTAAVETEDFVSLEKELIRYYKPFLNKAHKKHGSTR